MWAGKAAIQVRQARAGQKSPAELGYGTQALTIFVDDVDAHYAHAKAAGAKILEEPHETEYGEFNTQLKIWTDISGCSRGTLPTADPADGGASVAP